MTARSSRPSRSAISARAAKREAAPRTSSSARHAPGAGAAHRFERLLSACEAFAAARGAERVVAGVNVARRDAHRMMSERGYETFLEGIAMHRPDEPGYSRPECFVVDDLR
ncbi:MAG TPA: hypothetical protein VEX11_15125 [Acetobacteraceae bacterium]|nr:hypothetical protein [Acetobacteraceae bacterium]